MKKIALKTAMLSLTMLLFGFGYAQSLPHPIIWGTLDDQSKVLEHIEHYSWAKSMVDQLQDRIDKKVTTHLSNPNAILNTILPMFGEQGVWPESVSYSFMPNITMILNIVGRIKPEMNILSDNMHILEGNFLLGHLRYPDRRFVRCGDSKRNTDGTDHLYIFSSLHFPRIPV